MVRNYLFALMGSATKGLPQPILDVSGNNVSRSRALQAAVTSEKGGTMGCATTSHRQ